MTPARSRWSANERRTRLLHRMHDKLTRLSSLLVPSCVWLSAGVGVGSVHGFKGLCPLAVTSSKYSVHYSVLLRLCVPTVSFAHLSGQASHLSCFEEQGSLDNTCIVAQAGVGWT